MRKTSGLEREEIAENTKTLGGRKQKRGHYCQIFSLSKISKKDGTITPVLSGTMSYVQ